MATKKNVRIIDEFISDTWYGFGTGIGHNYNMSFNDDTLYTYGVPLAHYDRMNHVMQVNMKRYSVTSSRHRNLLLDRLNRVNVLCNRIIKKDNAV